MTVVQYPVGSLYEKLFGLRFLPPETLIEYLVEKYQQENDVVIFLSHLGLDWDRRLAKQIEAKPRLRCDLILGGHTHIVTKEPEQYGHTRISHVGSHSEGFGVWELNDGWRYRYHKLGREAVAP
jgi:2',3'-cyclic-nucleotide 2'-phosphodiesterase (5'-nucleotidase family)